MPIPIFAEVSTASCAGMPTTCSICSRAFSGSAEGRSILLMTGTIARSWCVARYALASVWASTPWVASTTSTAPSHAASERETS